MRLTDADQAAKKNLEALGHSETLKDSKNPKALMLILAYLGGTESAWLKVNDSDLRLILKTIPVYLDLIIDICLDLVRLAKTGETKKTISCKNLLSIMMFSLPSDIVCHQIDSQMFQYTTITVRAYFSHLLAAP